MFDNKKDGNSSMGGNTGTNPGKTGGAGEKDTSKTGNVGNPKTDTQQQQHRIDQNKGV